MLQSIVSGWNHDGDPAEMLMVNKQVELFKQRLAEDPEYLQKKIKQYWKVRLEVQILKNLEHKIVDIFLYLRYRSNASMNL